MRDNVRYLPGRKEMIVLAPIPPERGTYAPPVDYDSRSGSQERTQSEVTATVAFLPRRRFDGSSGCDVGRD